MNKYYNSNNDRLTVHNPAYYTFPRQINTH